ncbi:MAG: hypothetical protein U0414_33610 [Polyangiaceae bacterium]
MRSFVVAAAALLLLSACSNGSSTGGTSSATPTSRASGKPAASVAPRAPESASAAPRASSAPVAASASVVKAPPGAKCGPDENELACDLEAGRQGWCKAGRCQNVCPPGMSPSQLDTQCHPLCSSTCSSYKVTPQGAICGSGVPLPDGTPSDGWLCFDTAAEITN